MPATKIPPWAGFLLLFRFRRGWDLFGSALFTEDEEIEDLKDSEGVHDKEDDEPDLTVRPR